MQHTSKQRYVLWGAFTCYALVVLKLILFKPRYSAYVDTLADRMAWANVSPFSTIMLYAKGQPTWEIALRNLVGNLVLFLPLGIFLPLLLRTHSWKKTFLLSFVISALFEIAQILLARGNFDVDDVILNTAGAMLGYGIWWLGTFIVGQRS